MAKKDNTKFDEVRKLIDCLEKGNGIGIESEIFSGLTYFIKNNHIIVITANQGKFAIEKSNVKDFIDELVEIYNTWFGGDFGENQINFSNKKHSIDRKPTKV